MNYTMSRKFHKAMWSDGEMRRRSPRISALDASKNNDDQQQQLQPRMKRKLDDDDDATLPPSTSKIAKQVWKGKDSSTQQNEDQATKCVEWRSLVVGNKQKQHDSAMSYGKPSELPAKDLLQLVLDTLQRRDTHELFAMPVNLAEVEDYKEIIKEPMDFATMRAKLHENMYKNLDQFEHDVFLIAENAMYFNSSSTLYFRQARTIHELAKKAFNSLKKDPENFVLEFSGTRRRSMRKAMNDTRDAIPNGNVSSKEKLDRPSPCIRKTGKKNLGFADYSGSRSLLTGSRLSRMSRSDVEYRRSSYLNYTPPSNNNEAPFDLYDYTSGSLCLMNQGEICYEESLMRFVKDLGPIAQRVAKRKLLGLHQISSERCVIPAANSPSNDRLNVGTSSLPTFRNFSSMRPPFFRTATHNIIDLTRDAEESINGRNTVNELEKGRHVENTVQNNSNRAMEIANGGKVMENGSISKKHIMLKNPDRSVNVTRNMNKKSTLMRSKGGPFLMNSSSIKGDNVQRPVILALENPRQSNVSEYKGKYNKKSLPPLPWSGEAKDKGAAIQPVPARAPPAPAPALPPTAGPFRFDVLFLKEQLSKMNNVAMERSGGSDQPLMERGGGELNKCTRQADHRPIGNVNNFFLYNLGPKLSGDTTTSLQKGGELDQSTSHADSVGGPSTFFLYKHQMSLSKKPNTNLNLQL